VEKPRASSTPPRRDAAAHKTQPSIRSREAQTRSSFADDLIGLLGGLVDEGLVDVGDHTAAGDGRLDEGVELLVTTDGELKVAGGDALDLLRLGRDVTRQRLDRTTRNDEFFLGFERARGSDAARQAGLKFKSGCRLFKRL